MAALTPSRISTTLGRYSPCRALRYAFPAAISCLALGLNLSKIFWNKTDMLSAYHKSHIQQITSYINVHFTGSHFLLYPAMGRPHAVASNFCKVIGQGNGRCRRFSRFLNRYSHFHGNLMAHVDKAHGLRAHPQPQAVSVA